MNHEVFCAGCGTVAASNNGRRFHFERLLRPETMFDSEYTIDSHNGNFGIFWFLVSTLQAGSLLRAYKYAIRYGIPKEQLCGGRISSQYLREARNACGLWAGIYLLCSHGRLRTKKDRLMHGDCPTP